MFRNYFKIAIRNLWKNKGYMFINVGGLMTGIACCLLIALYVFDELSYETWNPDADRTYRISSDIRYGGNAFDLALASDPMGPTLAKEYPEMVEAAVRFRTTGTWVVNTGANEFIENDVLYADSTLFDVFPLRIIAGSADQALAVNCMVLNESTARKFFTTPEAAIGRSLQLDKRYNYQVKAVVADLPANTHLVGNMLLSMSNRVESRENNWSSHNYNTYLLLKKGVDAVQFQRAFDGIQQNYVAPAIQKILGISLEELRKQGSYMHYSLQPIRDIHLHPHEIGEYKSGSNIRYVYIFSAVAFFILLIACINFMNLATAQSAGRAREVGIRKVLGGERNSIIARFLSESTLTVLLALLLALVVVVAVLPGFNTLSGKTLTLSGIFQWRFVAVLLLLPFIVGLLAGSYPAFFLSAFQPIAVLKGRINNNLNGAKLRSVLVVVQFAMSVILLTGTYVIYQQLRFIQQKKVGFDREQALVVQNTFTLKQEAGRALKQELEKQPGVMGVSLTSYLPVPSSRSDNPYFPGPSKDNERAVSMQNWYVDHDYIKALNIQMADGRFFSPQFPTDSSAIILNETAARMLGYKAAVGSSVYYFDDNEGKRMLSSTVIGVVKNFHFESMHSPIGPLCMFLNRADEFSPQRMLIRASAGSDKKELVAAVEKQWKAIAPGQPFSYSFLDNDFDDIYRAEQKVGEIAFLFASLAIIIACLGLFGLVAYIIEQRTKEIGIRKVLGASAGNVVTLLSRDFLKLVLIAIILATPLAWYLMHRWLQDYEYRISLQWWMFLTAGAAITGIAMLTISFQSIRAALSNPIKALKTE